MITETGALSPLDRDLLQTLAQLRRAALACSDRATADRYASRLQLIAMVALDLFDVATAHAEWLDPGIAPDLRADLHERRNQPCVVELEQERAS